MVQWGGGPEPQNFGGIVMVGVIIPTRDTYDTWMNQISLTSSLTR